MCVPHQRLHTVPYGYIVRKPRFVHTHAYGVRSGHAQSEVQSEAPATRGGRLGGGSAAGPRHGWTCGGLGRGHREDARGHQGQLLLALRGPRGPALGGSAPLGGAVHRSSDCRSGAHRGTAKAAHAAVPGGKPAQRCLASSRCPERLDRGASDRQDAGAGVTAAHQLPRGVLSQHGVLGGEGARPCLARLRRVPRLSSSGRRVPGGASTRSPAIGLRGDSPRSPHPAAPLTRRRRMPAETSVTTSPTGNGSRTVTAAFVSGLSYIAFNSVISFFFLIMAASLAPFARSDAIAALENLSAKSGMNLK